MVVPPQLVDMPVLAPIVDVLRPLEQRGPVRGRGDRFGGAAPRRVTLCRRRHWTGHHGSTYLEVQEISGEVITHAPGTTPMRFFQRRPDGPVVSRTGQST